MTTVIDALHILGRATWEPLWIPMISWTLLVVPVWGGLTWTARLHPHAEYRVAQVLLATLPLGILAAAGADLFLDPARLPNMSVPPLRVSTGDVVASGGSSSPSWSWVHGIGLLSLAGGLAGFYGLVRLLRDGAAVWQLRNDVTVEPPSPARLELDRITEALAVDRPVDLRLSPHVVVPVTLGGPRPLILLPAHLTGTADELRMTLMHECVHVRRYDDVSNAVERLITAVFRIHPLVGRLHAFIEGARERACDAEILDDPQTKAHSYARLLLSFADAHHEPLTALGLSESPSSLKSRLHAMKSTIPQAIRSSFGLGITALALGTALTIGIGGCSESVSPATDEGPGADDAPSTSIASAKRLQSPPQIEGGLDALSAHIEYPAVAKEAGIQGRVFVQFIVTETGETRQVRVTRGVHEALDSAAVRAVRSVNFVPGRKEGTPVATKMTLPVSFQLPNTNTGDDPHSSVETSASALNARSLRIKGGMDALRKQISYPELARKAGIEGTVHLTVTVNEEGSVENAEVQKGAHDALNAAALAAVHQVEFTRTTTGNASTPVRLTIPIRFALPDDDGDA